MVHSLPSGACPHCGKIVVISPAPLVSSRGYPAESGALEDDPVFVYRRRGDSWMMAACPNCSMPLLYEWSSGAVLPALQPASVDHRVPSPMRDDLEEANACLSIGAFNATVTMARRAIQSACIHQGAPKQKLYQQIQWLLDQGLITKSQKLQADTVRWVGNEGAHPEPGFDDQGNPMIASVAREDAADVVMLGLGLMRALYVDASIAAAQRKRLGKDSDV